MITPQTTEASGGTTEQRPCPEKPARRAFLRLIAANWVTFVLGCGLTPRAVAAPAAAATQAGPPRKRGYDLRIEKRRLAGATSTIQAIEGEIVELRWSTDEATTLHLHGYDLELALEPGTPASMTFAAYATGRFPLSAHGFGARDRRHPGAQKETTILYLEVHPR